MLVGIVWRVPLDDGKIGEKKERTEQTKVCTTPDVRASLCDCVSTIALDTSLAAAIVCNRVSSVPVFMYVYYNEDQKRKNRTAKERIEKRMKYFEYYCTPSHTHADRFYM